jgi:hypothetical protein
MLTHQLRNLSRVVAAVSVAFALLSPLAATAGARPAPSADPTQWGEWVADVERPAERKR